MPTLRDKPPVFGKASALMEQQHCKKKGKKTHKAMSPMTGWSNGSQATSGCDTTFTMKVSRWQKQSDETCGGNNVFIFIWPAFEAACSLPHKPRKLNLNPGRIKLKFQLKLIRLTKSLIENRLNLGVFHDKSVQIRVETVQMGLSVKELNRSC